MDPVVHFEMPCDDRRRITRFYQEAFGWSTEQLGEEMGHYVLARTTESGERGPLKPGAINGGFYGRRTDMPDTGPSVVIAVENLGKAMKRVDEAGGRVLGEPMEIPGVGLYVSFTDTEGNRLSMLEPDPASCGESNG